MDGCTQKTILLIAFYNKKALGVRYLETALTQQGYAVSTVFFKDFNSVRPSPATGREIGLLCGLVRQKAPLFIGLSVMSSMYLDTVHAVLDALRQEFDIPIVCGGAYATMFPDHFLDRGAQYVIRADGERAVCRLADALRAEESAEGIPSLCFRRGGETVTNPIGSLPADIDAYGIPAVRCADACFIGGDRLVPGDPQRDTLSYEIAASRGCPFSCSYCCSVNLRRLFPAGIPYVRTRTVQSVIAELQQAKEKCPRLVFIHFYDEIFPAERECVDEFVRQYREKIALPFTIWSHPQIARRGVLEKLKAAGLTEVIMGIQSGSERVRRDVFHRRESQEEILAAVQAIRDAGVPWASYDFMLRHPFETLEDLKETYFLVKQMRPPFELQLHGLNFLPGTDIVPMAIEQGLLTEQEMEATMYAPMQQQFGAYWQREAGGDALLWYRMIDCLQFSLLRPLVVRWEENPGDHSAAIGRCWLACRALRRARYIVKKGGVVLKSRAMRHRK